MKRALARCLTIVFTLALALAALAAGYAVAAMSYAKVSVAAKGISLQKAYQGKNLPHDPY